MKKRFFALFFWMITSLMLGAVYLYMPRIYSGLEGQIRDIFFQYRGTENPKHKIIIADIDEKSLALLGQWPWARNNMADLLRILKAAGVAAIGLDMVFPEPDRTSASLPTPGYKKSTCGANTGDQEFSESIRDTIPVLGFAFDMDRVLLSKSPEDPSATIVKQGEGDDSSFYQAKSMISNLPMIQKELRYNGFINMVPDRSGAVRSAPLLMRFHGMLYPSFDLEMLRYLQGGSLVKLLYEKNEPQEISIGNIVIPVSHKASVAINYRGGTGTYSYVSIVDILRGKIPSSVLKDAIVLVGTSAAGLVDLKPTPYSSVMPGIEIHANILDNLLSSDFIKEPFWIVGFDLVFMLLIFSIAFMLFLFLNALAVFLMFLLLAYAIFQSIAIIMFDEYFLVNTLFPFVALFLALIFAVLIDYFYESSQRKRIRKAFAKKVSPAVIEELVAHADSKMLQSMKREVTVFFSDIRNFTLLTEELQSPAKLIDLLNGYIAPMSHIISSKQGTVDKYIGDAIMAYWNAPQEIPAHADAALEAAFEQLSALEMLNKTIKAKFGIEISIGIGIHTGEVIVGEVGSAERSDYTVIGHGVNLASRLEELNKRYGTQIIISEQTKNALISTYTLREIAKVHFRKEDPPESIYEVLSQGEADIKMREELAYYHKGLGYYYASQWKNAYEIFEVLNRRKKGSCMLYRYYMDRTKSIQKQAKKITLSAEIL